MEDNFFSRMENQVQRETVNRWVNPFQVFYDVLICFYGKKMEKFR